MCVREAETWTGIQGEIGKNFLNTQDRIKNANKWLEIELMKDIKDNRKGFYRYSSRERETGNNVGVLTKVVGDQLRESMCSIF